MLSVVFAAPSEVRDVICGGQNRKRQLYTKQSYVITQRGRVDWFRPSPSWHLSAETGHCFYFLFFYFNYSYITYITVTENNLSTVTSIATLLTFFVLYKCVRYSAIQYLKQYWLKSD